DPRLREQRRPQLHHWVGRPQLPAHPAPVEAIRDHVLTCPLDGSAPDRIPPPQILRVAHPLLLPFEVGQLHPPHFPRCLVLRLPRTQLPHPFHGSDFHHLFLHSAPPAGGCF